MRREEEKWLNAFRLLASGSNPGMKVSRKIQKMTLLSVVYVIKDGKGPDRALSVCASLQ